MKNFGLPLISSVCLAIIGCGGLTWTNVKDSTEAPGACKVSLLTHDGEDFRFGITNSGAQPVTVLVDSIKLVGPKKSIAREGGHPFMGVGEMVETMGQGASPSVAPGATITVFAHYDLDDAELKSGDTVRIDFTGALLANGAAITVPPLEFSVK